MSGREKNIRVLIAEDDYLTSTMIETMLEDGGYVVVGKAVDGWQAVEMTSQLLRTPTQPDVILMDVKMPDMDGIEATRLIQKRCPTPVVVLTAYETEELVAEASAAGVGAYLVKPPGAREMERAITIAITRFDDMMALRRSEERFRAITENTTDFTAIFDQQGAYKYASPSAKMMGGYSIGELLSEVPDHFVHPDDMPMLNDAFARAIQEPGTTVRVPDFRARHRDGHWLHLEGLFTGMLDVPGVNGIVFNGRDITERKQAEKALQESHQRLEETLTELRETQEKMMQRERLAAVGQLAAGIAHEFNNILASISLYTQMSLHMTELSPQVRDRLEIIAREGDRAANLVQQILDFGRRAPLRRKRLNLVPLVQETMNLLVRSLPQNIEIDLSYGSEQYVLDADPMRVQQAIVNLALNARDAMPEGGKLCIGLKRLRIEQGIDASSLTEASLPEIQTGEWIQVTVTDTGTGIPPDVLPHIYEPFFTTRAPLGHGLGLAQVHGIVKQHGGHVAVDTEVGRGTTFSLYWPALPESHQPALEPELPDLPQGSGEVILVVEDNVSTRAALGNALEMLGYRVLEAVGGREALKILERRKGEIALLLCDWTMPLMGGRQIARELRDRHLTVNILMLIDHPLDIKVKEKPPEGVVGWVQKPPGLEQLAEAVARALREESG